jgi:hypothetical protein
MTSVFTRVYFSRLIANSELPRPLSVADLLSDWTGRSPVPHTSNLIGHLGHVHREARLGQQ